MPGTDPGTAREEAERLVATLLAAARVAGAGRAAGRAGGSGLGDLGGLGGLGGLRELILGVLGHSAPPAPPRASPETRDTPPSPPHRENPSDGGFATGSFECCICPVCRGIAALRDPSPEFAERLATGAGELAAGVVHLLRAFAEAAAAPTAPTGGRSVDDAPTGGRSVDDAPTGGRSVDDPARGDQVWREATRTGHDSWPAPERDVWAAATHADAGIGPGGATPPADVAGPAGRSHPPVHRPGGQTSAPARGSGVAAGERPAVPVSRAPEVSVVADDVPGDGD